MNLNDTNVNDDLLVKYLLDEATATERQQVENWISLDPANQKYFNDLKLIIEKSELAPPVNEKDYDALDRLNQRMENEGLISKQKSFFTWTRAVAAILIVSVSGWLGYTLLTQGKSLVNVQTTSTTLKQELPDGSMVTLNKNSQLSANFSGETRAINLKGEAFFKVEPDKKKPFIIKVNNITVKVVGTSFNVKSRNEHTLIIVETGIVKVSKANQSIELRKGEKIDIADQDLNLSKTFNSSKLYNYYYSNEIVCNQTRLDELVPILNEKFNVKISITKPSLLALPINTTFTSETLDHILYIIAKTHAIQIVYSGKQILLK
jgi:transmembrane sensor